MIAVLGEALIDAHVDGESLRTHLGGGPYNAAVALGRLGVPASFGGTVSCDAFGARLLAGLEAANVSFAGCVVDAPSPLAVVDPSLDGGGRYRFYLRGTAFEHEPSPSAAWRDAEALVVGSLGLALDRPGAAIEDVAVQRPGDRLTVVDPNVRTGLVERNGYRERLERLAHAGAFFKLSIADADALFPGVEAENVADALLAHGALGVVVTSGADGAAAFGVHGAVEVRAPAVDVVDTVGAGDAFTAGLLAWLWRAGRLAPSAVAALEPGAWREALTFASATGAAQCTRASAWGPSLADVNQVLASEFVRGG